MRRALARGHLMQSREAGLIPGDGFVVLEATPPRAVVTWLLHPPALWVQHPAPGRVRMLICVLPCSGLSSRLWPAVRHICLLHPVASLSCSVTWGPFGRCPPGLKTPWSSPLSPGFRWKPTAKTASPCSLPLFAFLPAPSLFWGRYSQLGKNDAPSC